MTRTRRRIAGLLLAVTVFIPSVDVRLLIGRHL